MCDSQYPLPTEKRLLNRSSKIEALLIIGMVFIMGLVTPFILNKYSYLPESFTPNPIIVPETISVMNESVYFNYILNETKYELMKYVGTPWNTSYNVSIGYHGEVYHNLIFNYTTKLLFDDNDVFVALTSGGVRGEGVAIVQNLRDDGLQFGVFKNLAQIFAIEIFNTHYYNSQWNFFTNEMSIIQREDGLFQINMYEGYIGGDAMKWLFGEKNGLRFYSLIENDEVDFVESTLLSYHYYEVIIDL